MSRLALSTISVAVWMLLAGSSIALAQPPNSSRAHRSNAISDQTEALIDKLNSRGDLIGTELPLDQILKEFQTRFGLQFMFDYESLKVDPKIVVSGEESPRVKYPTLRNVRLRYALEEVFGQLGLGFVIRDGKLMLMKKIHIRRRYYEDRLNEVSLALEEDDDDTEHTAIYPLVHGSFKGLPLKDAVQELAESIDATVVVDPVAAADKPITARLVNVPFDTAVGLLASQVRMHVVKRDRVLYVTSITDERSRQQLVREMTAVRLAVNGWPLTQVDLTRVSLQRALSQLGQQADVAIVIDLNVKFDTEPLVTAHLGRCSVDLAVALILEKYAPNLELVKHGQCLLITTRQAAERRRNGE